MIAFRIFGGAFSVRPLPTVMALFMLAVLLALGTWQVERLHWKENLIATMKTRMNEAPADASSLHMTDGNIDYRRAQAFGNFQHDKEMYLTSISLTGEGGYHVLTPMRLGDGRMLLVDRGWVPYDKKSPFTRKEGQVFGPVLIRGILRRPAHRWLQPGNHPERNEWSGIDLGAMAQKAGVPQFLPYVLEADNSPNPGGYPLGGQTRITLPNNHFVYAVTWYGLAAALLVIYGLSGWQRKNVKISRKT